MRRAVLAVATAVLGLTIGVFAQNQKGQQKNQSQPVAQTGNLNEMTGSVPVIPGVQIIQGPNRGDVRIAREVRHELLMLPYYSLFDDLRYKVDNGTVTLLGNVINPTLKSDSENVVKRIEGVQKVENKINILPPSPMDQSIRIATARAIFSYDGLSRYGWEAAPSIHIVVNGGHVTLMGVVDSQADKNAAGLRANGVPGVFSVNNELQVATAK
ncbi:MAG: BON domain-containing protein [Terriglobia bacterium]|jgi:hyperosmotically inducible protein|nr:BON domain-containing protein [Terriglobia bacterium]